VARISTPRLLGWQLAIAALLALGAALSGRGSVGGILLGAALLAASLLLQTWATRAAFGGSSGSLAVAIFTLKLGLLVGVGALALRMTGVGAMSFAAGATTLLLAIVVETCYADWSARGGR
jgi:hypothetical protein